jgi:hypothetical protein
MISVKATTKALSATLIVLFMAALLFGTWLIMPADVEAAQYEENATVSNATVSSFVSCGMPTTWSNGVEFGSVDPDSDSNEPSPDANYTMSAPSTNNVNVDFYIKTNAPMTKQGGPETIPLANYTWNMTQASDHPTDDVGSVALTTNYVEGTLCDNTPNGSNCYLHLWLDVPLDTMAGTYNNTLTVKCNQTD